MARLEVVPSSCALLWTGGPVKERRVRDQATGADAGPKLDDRGRQTWTLPAMLASVGPNGELEAIRASSVHTVDPPDSIPAIPLGAIVKVARCSVLPYVGGDQRGAMSVCVEGLSLAKPERAGSGASQTAAA